ncbi:MAG: polyphosphate:AMP phosphotransferase [Deferribacterales bacterium]
MLESFKESEILSKDQYTQELNNLRTQLIDAQYEFKKYKRPMIVILTGLDGAGKGELVNFMADIMDTRLIETSTFWQETDEERERPYYFRYWNAMPPGGKLGIFFNGWYDRTIRRALESNDDPEAFARGLEEAADVEKMLAQDGTVIVKIWAHITKKEQKKRHEKLIKKGKQSEEISKRALWYFSKYEKITECAEAAYKATHNEFAPWEVIDCTDRRTREIHFLRVILDNMNRALKENMPKSRTENLSGLTFPDVLGSLKQQKDTDPKTYRKELDGLIDDIKPLVWEAYQKCISTMIVFEGWDAAGKGGCIRRLLRAFDMRLSKVTSIAAPTSEELSRHYLWRFWRQVPRAGHIAIFDRSWYGRVLVERLENITPPADWFRGYSEINSFEKHLSDRGVHLVKFFLHITDDEQLDRFKERQEIPWKQHKITDEDWRNREKNNEYQDAYNEMFFKTSTKYAPWKIIPANDKKGARTEVLKHIKGSLQKVLNK